MEYKTIKVTELKLGKVRLRKLMYFVFAKSEFFSKSE